MQTSKSGPASRGLGVLAGVAGAVLLAGAVWFAFLPADAGPGAAPDPSGSIQQDDARDEPSRAVPADRAERPQGRAATAQRASPSNGGDSTVEARTGADDVAADESNWDRVAPLDGQRAATGREHAGGSLTTAVDRELGLSPTATDTLFWSVEDGWGLEGVRAVAAEAARRMAADTDPRLGPTLLLLAETEAALGLEDAAGQHLVEAVLAMDAEPDWPRGGVPRLVWFAYGANCAMDARFAPPVRRDAESDGRIWIPAAGMGIWDGGSARLRNPAPRDRFWAWIRRTAASEARTEPVFAATIWLHAVTSRRNHAETPETRYLPPPAAIHRATEGTGSGRDGATAAELWTAFHGARAAAVHADAAWSRALDAVERELARIEGLTSSPVPLATVVWSLSDEFERRFAEVDTPHADALRQIAARLVEFDPPPASSSEPGPGPGGEDR